MKRSGAYEAASCPTWPNEIKKLKLQSNTEPRYVLYTLLCTGRFLSTVIKQRVCVASQIFVDLRVNLSSQRWGQTEPVQCKLTLSAVSKSLQISLRAGRYIVNESLTQLSEYIKFLHREKIVYACLSGRAVVN